MFSTGLDFLARRGEVVFPDTAVPETVTPVSTNPESPDFKATVRRRLGGDVAAIS
jgi:hypothetical protein